ncbi:MAG: GNAT family N-acetyltransferase, partial [Actinomycetes bacterium]
VIGVDPGEQGSGLGTVLSVIGLAHLRDKGLSEAMLYVEESNTAAIRVYEKLGFSHSDTDVMFRHPASSA